VGRLAGLPAPVIARAREVLALLEGEAEHLVPGLVPGLAPGVAPARHRRGASGGAVTADVAQLGLFAPVQPHAVVDALRRVDVNTLTPLAALQLVAELAERARE
jgi:DNA mismatch repair protein MutS